ncbi:ImmA/IrrE family metallo-endopeptidase [Streptomyces sp. NPDC047042]|uniref:ImmA/IrrE family metallo-endopeptidase n=1 Tax=Streptomyces sp. NPDC047042 TaxID=3154807 RepID=UPI0033D458B4
MVAQNWSPLNAARNRAGILVEKLNLTPPVDVRALLFERAQVEYHDWSHQCDAVTALGVEPPRVFVRSGLPELRERFTLAHEWAHIELAWHVGSIGCQVNGVSIEEEYSIDRVTGSQEREANEFASRVLAPDRWLSPLVKSVTSFERASMSALLDALSQAEMSASAGLIALSRHLLPGHALFVDGAFAISQGTSWPGTPPLSDSAVDQYLHGAVSVEEFSHQGRRVLWALLIPQSVLPEFVHTVETDDRTPHKILTECCTRIFGADLAHSKALSINGVVGGVTRDLQRSWNVEAIAAVVHDRIQSRSDLREVLRDPEFPIYLHRKATAIVEKRSKS